MSSKTPTSPWYQPWATLALFSALLNVVWEMAFMSFYQTRTTPVARVGIDVICLVATLGDVGISLTSYAAASGITTRRWLHRQALAPYVTYLAVGLVMTIAFESVNVYVLHRWSYAPHVPTVAGISVLPLLQWSVLPPIVLWLARRHLAGGLIVYPTQEMR